jgi:cytochrome c
LRVAAILALMLLPQAAAVAQTPSLSRGAILFLQCRSCHSIKAGEPHKIGPNLSSVVGSVAASKPGYVYSAALATAKVRWTDGQLDAFLESPSTAVPGTKMVFAGLKRSEDRVTLIAYLRTGVP